MQQLSMNALKHEADVPKLQAMSREQKAMPVELQTSPIVTLPPLPPPPHDASTDTLTAAHRFTIRLPGFMLGLFVHWVCRAALREPGRGPRVPSRRRREHQSRLGVDENPTKSKIARRRWATATAKDHSARKVSQSESA
jgi:hypothetical protein